MAPRSGDLNVGCWVKRTLKMATLIVLGFCLVFSGCLLVLQRQLIFPGVQVQPVELQNLPPDVMKVEYQTSQGRQVAFYRPPAGGVGQVPSPLWVCFHGNGSAALHWLDFLHRYPDENAGFLLLDYPGYVLSEGKPSPRAMGESARKSLGALAKALGMEEAALKGDMATLGFSMGGGAALDFAAKHPVRIIVVSSTYTSLLDMAKRTAPWPFYHLLLHRYDNRARLAEIAAQPNPPRIVLFHGSNDEVIPVGHGRELARLHPDLIVYHEVVGGDHNSVLFSAQARVWKAMMGVD